MERRAKPVAGKAGTAPGEEGRPTRAEDSALLTIAQRLSTAIEQQAATNEILRVIRSSRTDVQPVFDAIATRALRLCDAAFSGVFRFDGERIHVAALANLTPEGTAAFLATYPTPPGRGGATQRAILTRGMVHIQDIGADAEYVFHDAARSANFRSALSVPMLRDGEAIGTITVYRDVARPFPGAQIELLKAFAEQAVIAIENVRVFTELQARNRELTIALDQQTATSEILRVISGSQTDVQPVFDTIVRNAVRLCGADYSIAARFDGELLHPLAHHGFSPEALAMSVREFPMRPSRRNMLGRAALARAVDNLPDMLADPDYSREFALAGGWRSGLAVPMLRDGVLIGAIAVARTGVGAFPDHLVALLQTFADQAVIAIENVRLFRELQDRNSALSEALEQQTATSEILRVISRSPTDVQPVFDTIAAAALKLCGANSVNVYMVEGDLVHIAALVNVNPAGADAVRRTYPRPIGRDNAGSRAVLTRAVVAIPDVLADPEYGVTATALTAGFRSVLAVPLMREERPIGSIAVGRAEPGPFPDNQIALLQTFADQAVIAIENVRLFTELQDRNSALSEALEQQTATSEILRVISSSPTDVQPVFDTIAQRAGKLCDAEVAVVSRFDGKLIELAAIHGLVPEGVKIIRTLYPMKLGAQTVTARVIRGAAAVHIPDVLAEEGYEIKDFARAAHYRSGLGVPIVRNRQVIGSIFVGRERPGLFADAQVQLLETFADQAVIAIENARLFKELEARNRDLTVALDQQTATSEILRAISSSPTDVQPVFDIIGESAERLCDAEISVVSRIDGELIRLVALHGVSPEGMASIGRHFPMRLDARTVTARTVRGRAVVHVDDALADPDYEAKDAALAGGYRACLGVPMFREGQVIGAIFVARTAPELFTDSQVELLKTFADQAVIAVENVRLFNELQARTEQLTRSVGELKALGEVGQAVSSTLELETVLQTIVSRATQLAGMDGGAIYEYDEAREAFHLHTTDRLPDELVDALRSSPIPKGEGAVGQLAVTREPVEIRDIGDAGIYQSRVREILIRLGYRSLLAVPLLREDHLLGGLVVNRTSAGAFAPQVIDLLRTFATQSALAIQNARLFREIADKSRQLEAASRHKSEFLANMSHELRTPLNAIIGFSEVLAERMFGEINDKQAEYLADILESGRHLLSLINDILDLSKIEAGRMELEPTEFNLPAAIENTLILVRERAHRRGIALARCVDGRLGTIRADERKVKQVLLNLLSNALKFTPEGGRIDVAAAVLDGTIEVAVTDTGVGIAPEDQAAVFEEFRQVGAASKKVEGTGLGLAISRKFIELHGGRIRVESAPGKGSTFAFTLPLTGTAPPDAAGGIR